MRNVFQRVFAHRCYPPTGCACQFRQAQHLERKPLALLLTYIAPHQYIRFLPYHSQDKLSVINSPPGNTAGRGAQPQISIHHKLSDPIRTVHNDRNQSAITKKIRKSHIRHPRHQFTLRKHHPLPSFLETRQNVSYRFRLRDSFCSTDSRYRLQVAPCIDFQ